MNCFHKSALLMMQACTHQVSNLCQINHGVDVIVALNEGQATFLSYKHLQEKKKSPHSLLILSDKVSTLLLPIICQSYQKCDTLLLT